jgi:hypothetical protein
VRPPDQHAAPLHAGLIQQFLEHASRRTAGRQDGQRVAAKLVEHPCHIHAATARIGVLMVHADLVRRHNGVRIGSEIERGIQRQRDQTWLHGDRS